MTGSWLFDSLPNGTVIGKYYRKGFVQLASAILPDNLFEGNSSAIATGEDAMLYGNPGDSILQYSISDSDLSAFEFLGTVLSVQCVFEIGPSLRLAHTKGNHLAHA
ncbi:hypothetical protein GGR57DRAFT_387421 [Xylariaceae sp. FL1272]|nr:hypothetical protein GGR57DRAFT_387421 [Xylariaceae sp. FL1272]